MSSGECSSSSRTDSAAREGRPSRRSRIWNSLSSRGMHSRARATWDQIEEHKMLVGGASLAVMAAGALWAICRRKRRAKRAQEAESREKADVGPTPNPLPWMLCEVEVPAPPASLLSILMDEEAAMLQHFHHRLGNRDLECTTEQCADHICRTVTLRYITPLNRRFAPSNVHNMERLEIAESSDRGFVVQARCRSSGVPFASSFVNCVQWVATSEDGRSTKLEISGECRFTGSVWGPIKSQIERDSEAGLRHAYGQLPQFLRELQPSPRSPARATRRARSPHRRASGGGGAQALVRHGGSAGGGMALSQDTVLTVVFALATLIIVRLVPASFMFINPQ